MIIIIEGNIGAGKSTLIDPIYKYFVSKVGQDKVQVIHEPVEDWCNKYNLLERYYTDIAKDGLQFQIDATFRMLENERRAVKLSKEGNMVVMERSLLSTLKVFGPAFLQTPGICDEDKQIYDLISRRFSPEIGPHGYKTYYRLYVETPVNVCLDRIRMRGRRGEERVTADYLVRLESNTINAMVADGNEQLVSLDGLFVKHDPLSTMVNFPDDLDIVGSNLQQFLDSCVSVL